MYTLTLTPEQLTLVEDAFHFAGLYLVVNGQEVGPVEHAHLVEVDQFRPWINHPSILQKA